MYFYSISIFIKRHTHLLSVLKKILDDYKIHFYIYQVNLQVHYFQIKTLIYDLYFIHFKYKFFIIKIILHFVLTTPSLKKDKRYILGKATNLTNRLSTYNKSDEHEVVYYKECGDEDTMGIAEQLVFQRIKEYREQANRERFILPKDEDIEFFIKVLNEVVTFVNNP